MRGHGSLIVEIGDLVTATCAYEVEARSFDQRRLVMRFIRDRSQIYAVATSGKGVDTQAVRED
jgi:hypothetical protein